MVQYIIIIIILLLKNQQKSLNVNLSAWEKTLKTILPIKKEHDNDNDKTISYKINLFILVDSFKVSYLILLITYLKLTIRIAKIAWREIISYQNVILLGLKIID